MIHIDEILLFIKERDRLMREYKSCSEPYLKKSIHHDIILLNAAIYSI
ncbi:hypothetical protein [Priestia koreensis]|nr:hypothetical protein [Priestia koreensis]